MCYFCGSDYLKCFQVGNWTDVGAQIHPVGFHPCQTNADLGLTCWPCSARYFVIYPLAGLIHILLKNPYHSMEDILRIIYILRWAFLAYMYPIAVSSSLTNERKCRLARAWRQECFSTFLRLSTKRFDVVGVVPNIYWPQSRYCYSLGPSAPGKDYTRKTRSASGTLNFDRLAPVSFSALKLASTPYDRRASSTSYYWLA